jgi:TonB family protein
MKLTYVLGSGMAAAVLCASPALAEEGGGAPRPVVITNPDWVRKPTVDDALRYYPAHSGKNGGRAEISCRVTVRGTLDACEVISESPQGKGFGAAALAMASIFEMRPQTVDGQPVGGGTVRIPIRFGMSGSATDDEPETAISVARSLAWEETPTAAEFAAAFPDRAKGAVAAARVVLRCEVWRDRTLASCDVASEEPHGKGFGDAARRLAKKFRVASGDPNLQKVRNLYVDVPFDFQDRAGSPAPPELYDVTWLKGPDPQMAGKLFPPAAIKAGYKTGVGVIGCTVRHDGGLSECAVVAEDPPAVGFGEVALAMTGVMVMNPWTRQGFPVDGAKIRIPVRLNLDASQSPPGAPAAAVPTHGAIAGDGACSERAAAGLGAAAKDGKAPATESCGK